MEPESLTIKYDSEEDCCQIVEEELTIKYEDIDNKLFRCGVCGHQTTSEILLKIHMKIHLVRRIHVCKVCRKPFDFIADLNTHMLSHAEPKNKNHIIIQERMLTEGPRNMGKNILYTDSAPMNGNLEKDHTTSVNAMIAKMPVKKPVITPYASMNVVEKLFLLECIQTLGLHKKYQELEEIKNSIKSSWQEMVTLFKQKDYHRNAEKLARTYFHLKNQAKTHIERFYKLHKGPEPQELDYTFVKLYPAHFEIPGINSKQLQEDVRKYTKEATLDVNDKSQTHATRLIMDDVNLKDKSQCDVMILNDVCDDFTPNSECSRISLKRNLCENGDGPLNKIRNTDSNPGNKNDVSNVFDKLKFKQLQAEEQRREQLYEKYLRHKEELFNLEKKHMEEMHKKDMEIKEMELMLLQKKVEAHNSGS